MIISALFLLFCATLVAGTCPPYGSLKSCLDAAANDFKTCKDEMGDLLTDPDAVAMRYYAYNRLNQECPRIFASDTEQCLRTCH